MSFNLKSSNFLPGSKVLKYTNVDNNGRLVKTVGAKLMWGTVMKHCSVLPSMHTHKQLGGKWSNFLHFVLEVFL